MIWPCIIEKAYAKIRGGYAAANGGYPVSALRTMVGSPTWHYDLSSQSSASDLYDVFEAYDSLDYIMAAGTAGGADSTFNALQKKREEGKVTRARPSYKMLQEGEAKHVVQPWQ